MTNKEYIQSCSEEELIKELIAYINEIDLCALCEIAFQNTIDCYAVCPDTEFIVAKFLKMERIADDNNA